MLGIITAVSALHQLERERVAFNDMLNSLLKEQSREMRYIRALRMEDQAKHQKDLEIAREGRSLNFWGNR